MIISNNMRKNGIRLLLFFSLLFLSFNCSSCSSKDKGEANLPITEATQTPSSQGNGKTNLSVAESTQTPVSNINESIQKVPLLDEWVELEPYYSIERTDYFVVTPDISLNEKLYLIRNFPKSLPEDIDEYFHTRTEYFTEIEVYDPENIEAGYETISLQMVGDEILNVNQYLLYNDERFYLFTHITRNGQSELESYVYIFNEDGSYINRFPYKADDRITKAVVMEDSIYISVWDRGYETKQIYALDITSEMGQRKISNESIYGMCKYDEENLLFVQYMEEEPEPNHKVGYIKIYMYNVKSDELVLFKNYDTTDYRKYFNANSIISIEYNPANNMVYLGTNYTVYNFDLESGDVIRLYYSDRSDRTLKDIQIYDDMLILSSNYGEIHLFYNFTGLSDQTIETLTVLNPGTIDDYSLSSIYRNAISKLNSKGMIYQLETNMPVSSDREYTNYLAKKLMAGDTDFDFFYIDSRYYQLLKEEYYADFSRNSTLSKSFDNMLPGIKELCQINGKLCLAPLSISFAGFQYSKDILENYNIEFDTRLNSIANFIEFFNANELKLKNANRKFYSTRNMLWFVTPFIQNYVSNFMSNHAEKDDLKQLVSDLEKMYKDELVYLDQSGETPSFLKETFINSTKQFSGIDYFIIPLYNKNAYQDADITYLAVNPNSPNVEKALTFLQYVMDENIRKESDFAIFEISKRAYANETTDDEISITNVLYDYSFLEGVESFSYYKSLLKNSVRRICDFEIMSDFSQLFEDYLDDKVEKNEVVNSTYRILEMMRDE